MLVHYLSASRPKAPNYVFILACVSIWLAVMPVNEMQNKPHRMPSLKPISHAKSSAHTAVITSSYSPRTHCE